jgi:hypothetical protein
MARWVTLEFDDNDAAEKFVLYMHGLSPHGGGVPGPINVGSIALAYSTVRAVFAMPTKFCHCGEKKFWSRSKRYGWWVHRCGKTSEAWGGNFHSVIAEAKNLLDSILAPRDEPVVLKDEPVKAVSTEQ